MNELHIDKTHWKKYRFDEMVQNIAERVEPSQTDLDVYVGLEHIDPDCLHLSRHGHPSDVEGTKLRFYKGDIILAAAVPTNGKRLWQPQMAFVLPTPWL